MPRMEVLILTCLTILLAMKTLTTTVCLWGSWLKDPLRMAGHRMATVATVRAAILIGRTNHTVTSPLT